MANSPARFLTPDSLQFPRKQANERRGTGNPVTRSTTKGTKGVNKQNLAAKPVKRAVKAVSKTVGAAATAVKGLVRATAKAMRKTRIETKETGETADEELPTPVTVTETTKKVTKASSKRTRSKAAERPVKASTRGTSNKAAVKPTSSTLVNVGLSNAASRKSSRRRKGRSRVGAARRKQQSPNSTVDWSQPAFYVESGCKRCSSIIKENDAVFKKSRYELNQKEPFRMVRLHSVIPLSVITGMPSKHTTKHTPESTPSANTVPEARSMVTRGQVGTVMRKRQYDGSEETKMSGRETRADVDIAAQHNPKRRRTSSREGDEMRNNRADDLTRRSEGTIEPLMLEDIPRNVVDCGSGTAPLVDTSGIEKKPGSVRSRRMFPAKRETSADPKRLEDQPLGPCSDNVHGPIAGTINPLLIQAVDIVLMSGTDTDTAIREYSEADAVVYSSGGSNVTFTLSQNSPQS